MKLNNPQPFARVLPRVLFLSLLGMLYLSSAYAGVEVHEFTDKKKEAQYKVLVHELRCLVCQNQNLADSNAELAQDLRQQVYEMINAGKTKEEIITYMVDRYGDFVLYRPPLKKSTLFLWFGPFLILLAGVVILVLFVRKTGKNKTDEINAAELEQVHEMLNKTVSETGKTNQGNSKQEKS